MDEDPVLEVLCVFESKPEEFLESGAQHFVMPLSKAREKIVQLIEEVVKGEVKYFAVNLHEEEQPLKRKGSKQASRSEF